MLQDIFPYKLNNQFDKDAKADDNDYVIMMNQGQLLLNKKELENNILSYPRVRNIGDYKYTYLFEISNEETGEKERYFYLREEELEGKSVPEEFEYADSRAIRTSKVSPKYKIFVAMTAKHIIDWYKDTTFCGRCGKPMEHSSTERAMKCPKCGYTAYPRIMPAVIVGVKNGDSILLTKYKTGFQHNALIAGFTEIGETVEETVAREVMEEAGVKVKNIKYYGSQPWGVANDILVGFYCEVDGDTNIHMDESELKYAEWVKREDIILQPDEFSLTNEMMKRFKDGQE